ncbi:MAG TPA: hypothetical protein VIJ62_09655 [Rhizomicrobium sp.]
MRRLIGINENRARAGDASRNREASMTIGSVVFIWLVIGVLTVFAGTLASVDMWSRRPH